MPCSVVFGLVRMQIGEARHAGEPLVPLRVVLHRARAERIEVRVDGHVERRQIGEVPHDLRLGQLGQGRGRGGQRARRAAASSAAAPARRTPASGARGGRLVGEFEQQFA